MTLQKVSEAINNNSNRQLTVTTFRCQAAAYAWTIVLSTLPLAFDWPPTSVSLISVYVSVGQRQRAAHTVV